MPGRILQNAAFRVSQVFNPLMIVTVVFLRILYDQSQPRNASLSWLAVFCVFGILLPMGPVITLYYTGAVKCLFVPERKKRIALLLVTLASCCVGLVVLVGMDAARPVIAVMACYSMQVFLMVVLSHRIKVSLHAAGGWGGWVMMFITDGLTALSMIPVPILVSWSRVVVRAHTPRQVLLGGCVGGGVTAMVFYYLTTY